MKQFIHTPKHLKTHRVLPGHALAFHPSSDKPLPGVNSAERQARRSIWIRYRAERRARHSLSGSAGFLGAALVLLMMLIAAMSPRANVLDMAADATLAETMPAEVIPSDDGVPMMDAVALDV